MDRHGLNEHFTGGQLAVPRPPHGGPLSRKKTANDPASIEWLESGFIRRSQIERFPCAISSLTMRAAICSVRKHERLIVAIRFEKGRMFLMVSCILPSQMNDGLEQVLERSEI
jgi:hypothetical protein